MLQDKGKIRFDSLAHRFDANETAFFARQLESIEETLYEFKQGELKYREFIPVSNRDNPGAMNITYRMFDKVGMAVVIAHYADDLPRADIFGREYTQPVKSLGTSVGFNTQELRAAAMAGIDLDSGKAVAARRAIRVKESGIAWNGDVQSGLLGLLSNENIPTLATLTGVGGFTWALKTALEIISDIGIMVSTVRSQSLGVHNADTLLLPIDQYNILSTRIVPNTQVTILQWILNNSALGLTTIDWLPTELDNAFVSGTKDGAICYERSSEILEQRIPMELDMLPVQEKGLELIIPGESRHGGVVVRYPLGMLFFTGI